MADQQSQPQLAEIPAPATTSHGSWEWDLRTLEVTWSPEVYAIHGLDPDEFEPSMDAIRPFVHPDDIDRMQLITDDVSLSGDAFFAEHRIIRPDGEVRTLRLRGSIVKENGQAARLIGTTEDITALAGPDGQLWHMANHDSLTGLRNRRRFLEELDREIAVARRHDLAGAVLMLDMDNFKDINDSLGHAAGDELLVGVGQALRGRLRATDTLARLGGDEFAVVLPGCDISNAGRVARDLLEGLREGPSVNLAGRAYRLHASVGIAAFGPPRHPGAQQVMAEADMAMFRAKREQGGGEAAVFDRRMRSEVQMRLSMESELIEALANDELHAVYQPIVSVEHPVPVAHEALVRWDHPVRGTVMPGEFIPIAERAGLIGEIGERVLRHACAEAAGWRRSGSASAISVNVSPIQLAQPGLADLVKQTLRETGLPPGSLWLEMTETSLLDAPEELAGVLSELRETGIRICVDDFGRGASSLSHLRLLPIDIVKIDRMFVSGVADRADDRAIVAAIISLADEMEMWPVAEGVEDPRQHHELLEMGCRFMQGFLYARPTKAADLDLSGYANVVQPGVGDPSVIREFMRQIGIPARVAQ